MTTVSDTLADKITHLLETGRDPDLIIVVGRITKAKNPEYIIQQFLQMPSNFKLVFCGGPSTKDDEELLSYLKTTYDHSRIAYRSCTPDETGNFYRRASLMLHASTTGLDKCVLEALACGCLVVTASPLDIWNFLPPNCRAKAPEGILH